MPTRTNPTSPAHPASTRWTGWLYRLALLIAVSEVALIVGSWLVSSAEPGIAMRSLLSPSGVRWYFGTYADRLATPWLAYIILGAMAWGCVEQSNLWSVVRIYCSTQRHSLTTQQVFALLISISFLALQIITIALLTLLPHAILLSVTGNIWPSSFSRSLVPILAFMATTTHTLYDVLSGETKGLTQIGQKITSKSTSLMPVLLLYCLAVDLVGCIGYVFGV